MSAVMESTSKSLNTTTNAESSSIHSNDIPKSPAHPRRRVIFPTKHHYHDPSEWTPPRKHLNSSAGRAPHQSVQHLLTLSPMVTTSSKKSTHKLQVKTERNPNQEEELLQAVVEQDEPGNQLPSATTTPIPGKEDSPDEGLRPIWPWRSPSTLKQRRVKPILRSGRFSISGTTTASGISSTAPIEEVCKISSIESDIPSLASTVASDSSSSSGGTLTPEPEFFRRILPTKPTRRCSEPAKPAIHFNPKVWVREFERCQSERETTWFSSDDLQRFRVEAVQRIASYPSLLATGTGRGVIQRQQQALFSHHALRVDSESDHDETEIKSILILDPHDVCANLFAKSLRQLFPRAQIDTAPTSTEAMNCILRTSYDVVIVEERLKFLHHPSSAAASGSVFLSSLLNRQQMLLVGVSAHLESDRARLETIGQADVFWSKPPPRMDLKLRDHLVATLHQKRNPSA